MTASNTAPNAAPACGVPLACRVQNPSGSTQRRNRRRCCSRRLVASGSGSAAALTRAHSSRSSGTDTRGANSTSLASAAGSAAAAALTTAACAADSSPRRNACSTAGCMGSRTEVSSASVATPVDVPALRARCSAAVLAPAVSGRWVCATRRASSVFPAAHNRSDASNTHHRSRDADPDIASGSNRSTSAANRSRISTASSNMCSTLPDAADRHLAVSTGGCN